MFRFKFEFIGPEPQGLRFRLEFHASSARWLLPYPEITGLQFTPVCGGQAPEWLSAYLISSPRDQFVLRPHDRISFELLVPVNPSNNGNVWTIRLPPAEYEVRHVFEVRSSEARSEYMEKGSRFADITPPWIGVTESNSVSVKVGTKCSNETNEAEQDVAPNA